MKRASVISVVVVLAVVVFAVIGINKKSVDVSPAKTRADVVYVGPKEGTGSLDGSLDRARLFVEKIRMAREAMDAGNYESATRLLNTAIPLAEFKMDRS